MEGDIGLPGLGLSDVNKSILINEVSIVFNGAASLRLEADLKDAIRHNTTGTKYVLDVAMEMKKLVVNNNVIMYYTFYIQLTYIFNCNRLSHF